MNNRLIIIAQVMIALAWFFVVRRAKIIVGVVATILFLGVLLFLGWPVANSHPPVATPLPSVSAISLDELSKELHKASALYGGKTGKLPLPGVNLIKEFEGFFPNTYPDPLWGWKTPTIGWGATQKADGSRWRKGDKITLKEADALLESQLEQEYLPTLEKLPGWEDMNVNQQGSLLSFGYNVGAAFYGAPGFRTISQDLRFKKWDEIPQSLKLYRNPGSVVEAGLLRRRIAEGRLFSQPV